MNSSIAAFHNQYAARTWRRQLAEDDAGGARLIEIKTMSSRKL
jgi:hypothetical protein